MAVAAKVSWWHRWWLLVLLVAALWSTSLADFRKQTARRSSAQLCELAPEWTASTVSSDGYMDEQERTNIMAENQGKVVLVAFVAASSEHSLEQAQKLEALQTHFHDTGMSDVIFVLVNSAKSRARLQNILLKNLTLTILQENVNQPVWSSLGGKKGHVFIYDRCSRLTYSIAFPLSIIHSRQNMVESSVTSTYLDDICGEQRCSHVVVNASSTVSNDSQVISTAPSEPEGQQQDIPATTKPSLLNRLRSLYHNVLQYMPWASKDKKDDRYENSARKFLDMEHGTDEEEATSVTPLKTEPGSKLCNITQKSICRAWPEKKLDHARVCCNLHSCNRSDLYLEKHCKHYTEDRCKKVELVMQCCHGHAGNGSSGDEQENTRASSSSHPKS